MSENEEHTAPPHQTIGFVLKNARLPMIVWVVVLTTFLACTYASEAFLYYSVSGFSWIIALVVSVMIVMAKINRISFPVLLWLPWIVTVLGYSVSSEYNNLQRSTMLLCPIIVGMAASTARVNEDQIAVFRLVLKMLGLAIIVAITFLTGLLLTGILPDRTGMAPQSITTLFLCSVFISGYSFGYIKDIFWYIAVATVPVIALTRGPIVVSGLLLPLSFSPIKLRTRLMLLGLVIVVGLFLFFTPRVQKKMFYAGSGTLEDVTEERKLSTSGRRAMAELLTLEIYKRPIWGHGANASEPFIIQYSGGQLTHPHNDWLRFLYDYGLFGTSVFAFTILVQVRQILKKARHAGREAKILLYGVASSWLAFILIMFTDNVVLYAAFFGNLQFTTIGLAYASEKQAAVDRWLALQEAEEEEEATAGEHRRRARRYRQQEKYIAEPHEHSSSSDQ